MCLCMYKIYILYYLDSLAISAKRVRKNFGTHFLFWKSMFKGLSIRNFMHIYRCNC